jgi:hypothetical protein
MPKFLSIIDMSNLEIVNLKIHNSPSAPYNANAGKGSLWMDTSSSRLNWSDGTNWQAIFPFDTLANGSTAVLRDGSGGFSAGTITATLAGNASTATKLFATKNIGISGTKVTATAAAFDGSADVNINITALSVAAGDIGLTNGSFLVGNGSNVAAVTAKSGIPLSGFGAAAADVAMGGYKITGLADPTNAQEAATKAYVDSTAQGLDVKQSVVVATTAALTATYVGSPTFTLTNSGAQAALVIDGLPLSVGNRILVKDQVDTSTNGIYVVTATGGASGNWVLTRASDFNTSAKISAGSFTFVEQGSSLGDTGWVMTSNGTPTLDTSALIWSQFSGAGSYTAGRGIVQSGTVFHFAQNSNYTIGDLPYATGTTTIGLLAAAAAGNALISNGAGAAPSWGKISASTLAQIAGLSILGTASSGASVTPSAITGTANQVLRVNDAGNALAFGTINLASGSAVAGILPGAYGGTGTQYAQFTTNGTTLRTYSLPNLNAQLVAQVSGTITGNNSTTVFNAAHNLNTKNIVVSVFDSSDDRVYVDTKTFDANTARFTFAVAPASGTVYRWVVVGC